MNEIYTPSKYIEAARAVMGGIDLDPASCSHANKIVQAERYFCKENNGLEQSWRGRVWLNPPYERGIVSSFVNKLVHEYECGRVDQAILLLLGNSCFNRYFRPLWKYPVCFHNGRIYFYLQNNKLFNFGYGSLFVYIGPEGEKFFETFSPFGVVTYARFR